MVRDLIEEAAIEQLALEKLAKEEHSVDPGWWEGQKAVSRAMRKPGAAGMDKIWADPELVGRRNIQGLKGYVKGGLGGAGVGAGVGALLGALKGRAGLGAGLGALSGGALGGLGGQVSAMSKADKDFLAERGIKSEYMGLKNRFTPKAAKKYVKTSADAELEALAIEKLAQEKLALGGIAGPLTAGFSGAAAAGPEDRLRGAAYGLGGGALVGIPMGIGGAGVGAGLGALLGRSSRAAHLGAGLGALAGAVGGGHLGGKWLGSKAKGHSARQRAALAQEIVRQQKMKTSADWEAEELAQAYIDELASEWISG